MTPEMAGSIVGFTVGVYAWYRLGKYAYGRWWA